MAKSSTLKPSLRNHEAREYAERNKVLPKSPLYTTTKGTPEQLGKSVPDVSQPAPTDSDPRRMANKQATEGLGTVEWPR